MIKKSAGILFTDGKKVLLLRKKSGDHEGIWGLPGGTFEKRDGSVFKTALREVKEETGLKKIPGKKIDSVFENETKCQWTTFIYQIEKPFKITLSSEHNDYNWVDLSKLSSVNLHPSFEKHLSQYIEIIKSKFSLSFKEWFFLKECSETIQLDKN